MKRTVYQCDSCKKIEDARVSDTYSQYTFLSKGWLDVDGSHACSKKCARELVDKSKAVEESKCSCCCKN